MRLALTSSAPRPWTRTSHSLGAVQWGPFQSTSRTAPPAAESEAPCAVDECGHAAGQLAAAPEAAAAPPAAAWMAATATGT